MSTIAPSLVRGSRQKMAGPVLPWRVLAVGICLAVAHLPLLIEHANRLWSRPHYQFFPFVLVGSALLAIQRLREPGTLHPGPRRGCGLLVGTSWGLLALAIFLGSGWLAAVAGLVTLAAVTFGIGGAALLRRLFPAWAFLWLVIPPPLGLDIRLVSALQTWTARWSSGVLDVFGVFHVLDGHVVEVGGRRLLVDEACSGIHSFFAVIPLTLLFLLWVRRPWLPAALLTVAAAAWVLAANVARVVGITLLTTRTGIDVSAGWRHEVFGLVVFAVTLALLWSTDRLLLFLTGFDPRAQEEPVRTGSRNGETASFSQRAAAARFPDLRRTWLAWWPTALAYGTLAVAQGGLLFYAGTGGSRFETAAADALPARWGPWQRQAFETEQRPRSSSEGEFSRKWRYRAGKQDAIVSLDYPFMGWHELSTCYQAQGWTLQERTVPPAEAADAGAASVVAVKFSKPLGQHGYLLFSFMDQHGRATAALQGSFWTNLDWRFTAGRRDLKPRYQLQLFVPSTAPLTPSEQGQAQAFFRHVRSTLQGVGQVREGQP